MRILNSAAMLFAVLMLPLTVLAKPVPKDQTHSRGLTLGLTAVQPVPHWDDAGFGLAPWIGFTLPVWRNLLVTARAGYIYHFEKTLAVEGTATESIDYSSWEMPVLVGVEYARPGYHGFLLSGEVGYVLRGAGATYEHEEATSSTDHGAGFALGAGYRIWRLEVRLHWIMLALPDPVKQKAVMLGAQWLLPI